MGCHTWFYRKVERSYQEAKKIWIETQLNNMETWKRSLIDNSDSEFSKELLEAYPEWTLEYCIHSLKVSERRLRMVEAGLCQKAVMNKQPDSVSIFIEGKGFYVEDSENDKMPHDLFRIYGYPTEKLFSLEETISFIEKYKSEHPDQICLYDYSIDKLVDFWKKYPDGMIDFG